MSDPPAVEELPRAPFAGVRDAPMAAGRKAAALAGLLTASVGWALAPIFIHYLSTAYDPYSQMLIRYGTGAAALTLVCLLGYREEFLRTFRRPWAIVPLALVTVSHQYCWTTGNYGATPTVAQLTTKLSVVLIVVFSFVLFHEERGVIRNPWYLFGTALSFLGMAAVLMKDPATFAPQFDRYAVLLLTTALFWSVYVVWAKHLVTDIHPVPMFTVLALWTTLCFVPMALLFGDLETLRSAGPRMTALVVLSGLIPIAAAHPCYHYAQKHLGAALCSSLNLVNPLFTYAFALMVWPDEHLLPIQWAGGAVLLAGTALVIVAGRRAARRGPSPLPEAAE